MVYSRCPCFRFCLVQQNFPVLSLVTRILLPSYENPLLTTSLLATLTLLAAGCRNHRGPARAAAYRPAWRFYLLNTTPLDSSFQELYNSRQLFISNSQSVFDQTQLRRAPRRYRELRDAAGAVVEHYRPVPEGTNGGYYTSKGSYRPCSASSPSRASPTPCVLRCPVSKPPKARSPCRRRPLSRAPATCPAPPTPTTPTPMSFRAPKRGAARRPRRGQLLPGLRAACSTSRASPANGRP